MNNIKRTIDHINGIDIIHSIYVDEEMPQHKWLPMIIEDAVSKKINLANAYFYGDNVYGHGGISVVHVDFSKINLENCKFKNIRLASCKFDKSVLRNCVFENCIIDECSFYNADLCGISFRKVDHPYLWMLPLSFIKQRHYSNFNYAKMDGGLVKNFIIADDTILYTTQSGEEFIKRGEQDESVSDWRAYARSGAIDADYAKETLWKAGKATYQYI